MSCNKRKLGAEAHLSCGSFLPKRICSSEDSSSSSFNESVVEEKKFTDQERHRIVAILEQEFDNELRAKEEEVVEIQERIQRTRKILQYLCYAVVSDFYSREKTITSVTSTRQRRIHPAVKKLLSGKSPAGLTSPFYNPTAAADSASLAESIQVSVPSRETLNKTRDANSQSCHNQSGPKDSLGKKIPRYIPPKPKLSSNHAVPSEPIRGGKNKEKTLLLVGNVSKWIPPDAREDAVTHKWMVYVRGPKDAPDISGFVSKVRFFLHPSYRPNDVVQVVCPPFQLSRRGWGEFPVRVQIHFSNPLNKPVDIIHNLKLDRTYSGLQTLGAETVAEVWIQRDDLQNEVLLSSPDSPTYEKTEVQDVFDENPGHSRVSIKEEPSSPGPSLSPSLSQDQLIDSFKCEPDDHETIPSSPSKAEILAPTEEVDETLVNHSPVAPGPSHSECVIDPVCSNTESNSIDLKSEMSSSETQSKTSSDSSSTSTLTSATRLVKCVDNKGTVRFVKMNTEVLSKLFKSGRVITGKPMTPAQGCDKTIVKKDPTSGTGSTQNTVVGLTSPSQPLSGTSVNQTAAVHLSSPLQPQHGLLRNQPAAVRMPSPTKPQTVVLVNQPPVVRPPTPSKPQSGLLVTQSAATPILPSAKIHPPASALPVVRPVIRVLRPPVNVGGGTVVISSNPRSAVAQAPVVARFTAPSNGENPVLVLKEGKLFLMKNVPGTNMNTIGSAPKIIASQPVINMPSMVSSSGISTQPEENPSSSCQPHVVTKTAMVTSPIKSPTITNTVAFVSNSKMVSAISDTAVDSISPLKQSRAESTSLGLKTSPRSLLGNSSAQSDAAANLKTQSSKDQLVHIKNGGSVVLLSNSLAQINKSSAPKPSRSLIKPGKSLLKAGISLLKTSATTNTKSSFILPPQTSTSVAIPLPPSAASKRIILGRSSGPTTVSPSSQSAQHYQEQILHAIQLCPQGANNMWRAVRWMIRFFPLVHIEAHLNEFKILHPYCAPSEKVFCSWNIGKQRACEWLRAKTIRQCLLQAGWDAQSVWTTREILLWARFHGYTPGLPLESEKEPKSTHEEKEDNTQKKIDPLSVCFYSEPVEAEAWLKVQEDAPLCNADDSASVALDIEEEIDIVSCDTSPSKARHKGIPVNTSLKHSLEEMTLEPSLHALAQMVSDTLKRSGINNLPSEEIFPGVLYPAAQRIIVQAIQSLVEDLTRRAFADAWGENVSRQPSSIEIKNVFGAILNRPELDLFTCSGLGICSSDSQIAENSQ